MNMIDKILRNLYVEFSRKSREGALANYIPELTKVDPNNFGIVLTTIDGHQYAYGDTENKFTLQSVSKPFVYGMAIQEHGVQAVLDKISVEPSGDAFNSISLYEETGRPFNPMINAGAITATSMIWQKYQKDTFEKILSTFNSYAGGGLEIDKSVYKSESNTGHRNRAIAYLLRNFNILESEVEEPLDAYFKQCSITVNCRQLSTMGATLSNNGVNPITGVKAIKSSYVPKVLSVMSTCGMYDYSGEWVYNVGLPAKSGVGGGVLAILPGQLALAIYSPMLDEKGNSVLGVGFCKRIAEEFSLHLYKTPRLTKQVVRKKITLRTARSKIKRTQEAEKILFQYGNEVHIMELQGDLCFATCELFMRDIPDACKSLILSLQKCISMDEAAIQLLFELNEEFKNQNKSLFVTDFSHLDMILSILIPEFDFLRIKTLDRALIHCENTLLQKHGYHVTTKSVDLPGQKLLQSLSDLELTQLYKYVKRKSYPKGTTILKKGSKARRLYFISSGQVTVHNYYNKKDIVHAILNAGNSFGEMALLDRHPRSANVTAETNVTCFTLKFDILDANPDLSKIKLKILTNLAASLSHRLRIANQEIEAFV